MSLPLIASFLTKTKSLPPRVYIVRRLCEPSDPSKNVKIIQSCAPKPRLCLDDAEKKTPSKAELCKPSGVKPATPTGNDGGDLPKNFARMRQLQERFQRPDGVPVFLKMGFRDQVLYRLTMLLALIGLGGIVKTFFYDMQ